MMRLLYNKQCRCDVGSTQRRGINQILGRLTLMESTSAFFLKQPGIYLITNSVNGKQYVGQSLNVRKRILAHKRGSDKTAIARAIRKYGADNFSFDVLEYCDIEQLDALETLYIQFAGSCAPTGYNIAPRGGSCRGVPCSPQKREKLSIAHKGRKFSAEHLASLSAAQRGRKHPPETLAKISKGNKGKRVSPQLIAKMNAARLGKGISDETRARMSASHGSRKKPVAQCSLDNALIAVFSSVSEASRETGFLRSGIFSAVNGKTKTAYGFKWVSVDNDIWSNGSLVGPTAYGMRLGFAPERPQQIFRLLDADDGFTAYFPVLVERKVGR